MATTAHAVEFESFDRLEDKVKQLVAVVGRLRADQAKLAEENARLTAEVESARLRLTEAQGVSAQMDGLKEERAVIRTRVSALLEQLEHLNL
jgi:FtsZ-binding cell division protein ZapB